MLPAVNMEAENMSLLSVSIVDFFSVSLSSWSSDSESDRKTTLWALLVGVSNRVTGCFTKNAPTWTPARRKRRALSESFIWFVLIVAAKIASTVLLYSSYCRKNWAVWRQLQYDMMMMCGALLSLVFSVALLLCCLLLLSRFSTSDEKRHMGSRGLQFFTGTASTKSRGYHRFAVYLYM